MEKVLDEALGDKLAAVEDVPTLDSVAREGARRMLLMALEEEVARTWKRTARRGTKGAGVWWFATAAGRPGP